METQIQNEQILLIDDDAVAVARETCKVFMLTSSINNEDLEKSKGYMTVHDFISKPLTAEKLRVMVR